MELTRVEMYVLLRIHATDFIKTYKNICIFTSFSIFWYHFNLSLPLKRIPSRLEQLQTLLFHLQKIIYWKKSLKILKGYVYWKWTGNTMAKIKSTKGQTTIYKTYT
jgi:hypothetical protein